MELLPGEAGDTVVIDKVLAVVKDGGDITVGTPYIPGEKVTLKIVRHGRGKKIVVFKFKPKKTYRRKQGHRQGFTQVVVEKIGTGSGSVNLQKTEEQGGESIGA